LVYLRGEKEMNTKVILKLYQAYQMIRDAKRDFKRSQEYREEAKESDILDIFEILSRNYPEKIGFSFCDIYNIHRCGFTFVLNEEQVSRVLWDAVRQGKVVYIDEYPTYDHFKLVLPAESEK